MSSFANEVKKFASKKELTLEDAKSLTLELIKKSNSANRSGLTKGEVQGLNMLKEYERKNGPVTLSEEEMVF